MYKIYGSDQKEYGPVNEETLRQWLADGRITGDTYILPEGGAEWQTLSSLPQFSSSFEQPAPAAAPGLRLNQEAQQATSYQPAGSTPYAGYNAPAPVATKTSGMAIASLVLGILGVFSCGICGLIGLFLGIASKKKINRSRGQLTGNGLAIAGICVSAVTTLFLIPFTLGLLMPAIGLGKARAQGAACVTNGKQLASALKAYAVSHNNQLPNAANWCDAIKGNISDPNLFKCPGGAADAKCHFGFNASLSKKNLSQINPQTVVLYEIDGGWNVSGDKEKMIQVPRHVTYTVVFADGTAQIVSVFKAPNLRWDP